MAVREYESWLLWGYDDDRRRSVKAMDPETAPRDAKGALRRLVPGYAPSTHQLEQTRRCDLSAVWAASRSFDKLVRSLAALVGSSVPLRPAR